MYRTGCPMLIFLIRYMQWLFIINMRWLSVYNYKSTSKIKAAFVII